VGDSKKGSARNSAVFKRRSRPVATVQIRMSKATALRGALGGLYAHNAAEGKKSREETRVLKMLRESDRQFQQQVRPSR
jgi:hypothetical protein